MSTFPSPAALTVPNVSATSITVCQSNLSRLGLYVFNPNQAVTIWIAPLGTTAAVNGAGSIAIQPLQGLMLGPPSEMPPFIQGLNAIASVAGTNTISLWEFYP